MLEGGEWSVYPPAALPQGKSLWYPMDRRIKNSSFLFLESSIIPFRSGNITHLKESNDIVIYNTVTSSKG
jgi:hypothetical protein